MKKIYFNGESKFMKRVAELLNRKPETGEGHEDAYYGDYSKEAYEHSQLISGNPHHVTAAELGLGDIRDKIEAIMLSIGTVSYWETSEGDYIVASQTDEIIEFGTIAKLLEYT